MFTLLNKGHSFQSGISPFLNLFYSSLFWDDIQPFFRRLVMGQNIYFVLFQNRLFRKDKNQHGAILIFYVNQVISCKTINTFNFLNGLEFLPSEISLRNKKVLVIGCYKPPSLIDNIFWISYTVLQVFMALHMIIFFLQVILISPLMMNVRKNSTTLKVISKTPTCFMCTNSSSIVHIITNMTSLFIKSRMNFAEGKS